ncbi:hypothetical protein KBW71_23185 [Hydrogenophaga aromaticivorans]|jgi:hypothetical protein|uniref:hypothetical protein n=1 Tax=Hydrogenophaga aromaticivorans TaxID=2610898 RepID=UPI001B35D657|nr:hypothetical protein [Hydrogenophaga aromaticivorans]MBQ0921352.1 hypothetical protein [Hydrogenophaga aromaticivorans]
MDEIIHFTLTFDQLAQRILHCLFDGLLVDRCAQVNQAPPDSNRETATDSIIDSWKESRSGWSSQFCLNDFMNGTDNSMPTSTTARA